jgi:hypothetical protein
MTEFRTWVGSGPKCVRRRNQSHPLARLGHVWNTRGHGDEKATEIYCSRKSSYTNFLFISHTCTVTPRYQPPSMADSVTSQNVSRYWGSPRCGDLKRIGFFVFQLNTQHTHFTVWGKLCVCLLLQCDLNKNVFRAVDPTPCVCVYYCRTYYKAVRGGGGRRGVEDRCYDRRRAEACVDESAHHAPCLVISRLFQVVFVPGSFFSSRKRRFSEKTRR